MVAYGWTKPQVMDLTLPDIRWLFAAMEKHPPAGILGMALFKGKPKQKEVHGSGLSIKTDPGLTRLLSRIKGGK